MKSDSFIVIAILIAFLFGMIGGIGIAKLKFQPEIAERTRIQAADADLLYYIYQEDTAHWNNVIINTAEYHYLDSLKEGYWEDFYEDF